MNITMSMVFDGLNKRFSCRKGDSYNPDLLVNRVELVGGSVSSGSSDDATTSPSGGTSPVGTPARPSDDVCCVATCSEQHLLVGFPHSRVVLGCTLEDTPGSCAIQVIGATNASSIQTAIREIIAWYEVWEADLIDLSLHGAGLEELVDFAHGLFGNPITIIDESYRLWAQTNDDTMDDALWESGVSLEQDLQGFSQDLGRDEEAFSSFLAALKEKGVLVNYVTSLGTTLSACIASSGSGAVVGVNIVQKNRTVTHGDIECLKLFADVVGMKMRAMEFSWQDSSGSYYALLQDIVRGDLSNSSEFKARLSRIWIKLDRLFTVFVVSGHEGVLRYHQLCRIEDELNDVFPQGTSVIASRALVMFVNHEEQIDEKQIEDLNQYAISRNLAIGVSESRTDECSLRTLYEQALFALRVQKRMFTATHLVSFDQCRSYYLFDLCSGQQRWEDYAHNCLSILSQYDSKSPLPLSPTLQCLVKNHGNRTLTSEELGIQRNTLQYRLKKIEEICSIDLGNEAVFDHIAFSIQLHDYCTKRN